MYAPPSPCPVGITRSASPAASERPNRAPFCPPGSANIVSTPCRRSISTNAPPPVILAIIFSLAPLALSFCREFRLIPQNDRHDQVLLRGGVLHIVADRLAVFAKVEQHI